MYVAYYIHTCLCVLFCTVGSSQNTLIHRKSISASPCAAAEPAFPLDRCKQWTELSRRGAQRALNYNVIGLLLASLVRSETSGEFHNCHSLLAVCQE
jgi:hypothetical protein